MTPKGRLRLGFGLKVAAYGIAAFAVMLFLDATPENDPLAVLLLFAAVAIRMVARRFDARPSSD